MATKIIGKETWSNKEATSQVYQATHDGAGNSLPMLALCPKAAPQVLYFRKREEYEQ